MPSTGQSLSIPIPVAEDLRNRNCVLFLGDSFRNDGGRAELLSGLLVDACKAHSACPVPACEVGGKCCKMESCAISLPRAAQLYEAHFGRNSLIRLVRRFFDDASDRAPIHPLYQAITALPVQVIITTSYDVQLEQAFRQAKHSYLSVVHDTDLPFHDPDRVQIIRLHGDITQPDSLILTEDDMADLFARLPTVTRVLQAHFATQTLIFIGYQLNDPYFPALYRQVTRPLAGLERRGFAIQWPADSWATERWQGKIEIIQAEPQEFVSSAVALVQPTLAKRKTLAASSSLPPEPYKFLDYYTAEDASIFFGRDVEAELLLSTVLSHKVSILYGRSGAGKTSLLLARLGNALADAGYRMVYTRVLDDPVLDIKAALKGTHSSQLSSTDRELKLLSFLTEGFSGDRLVIVLDQFEEFFIRQGQQVRLSFAQEIVESLWPQSGPSKHVDLRILLSLRDDFLASLDEIARFLPHDVFAYRYRLDSLTPEKAQLAISKPAEAFGLPMDEDLPRQLIADLEDQSLDPANLQIVLFNLYQDCIKQRLWSPETRQGPGLTMARYWALGGTKQMLVEYLDRVLDDLPRAADRQQAQAILKSMVTADQTKAAVTGREIGRSASVVRLALDEGRIEELLTFLRQKRVIRKLGYGSDGRYELAHEVLVERVWGWFSAEERHVLDLRDMLRRDISNYRKFHHLLTREKLQLLNDQKYVLMFEPEELDLILRSALATSHQVAYWFQSARAGGVAVETIASEGLQAADYRTRCAAVTALRELGQLFVGSIIPMLADPYPQVRIAAIATLESIQPDGTWRTRLVYERYVPAGEFTMGGARHADGTHLEGSVPHEVHVGGFYCEKYPVTIADYARYLNDAGYPYEGPDPSSDHPISSVSWYEASEYAKWAGTRLLSEAEWEKAARWEPSEPQQHRTEGRQYPWGNEWIPENCNTIETLVRDTTPVQKYSPFGDSPSGCSDMSGNVWEWCHTEYRAYPYVPNDGREAESQAGANRVQRGGSFVDPRSSATCASRQAAQAHVRSRNVGFRVGWSTSLPW